MIILNDADKILVLFLISAELLWLFMIKAKIISLTAKHLLLWHLFSDFVLRSNNLRRLRIFNFLHDFAIARQKRKITSNDI